MSARNFRFRSPGVRIEEIDESVIDVPVISEVGPVIVGRSQHGPMLKPVTVTSVDEFTNIFGVPSAGGPADSDLWRGENTTAPDYGSYAAIAYLRNSAPVTFVRLGGNEHPNKTDAGRAGWQTTKLDASLEVKENGGAYGLWMFPSGSTDEHGTGSLAAVFYIDSGSAVLMSGSGGYQSKRLCQFDGTMLSANFKLRVTASSIPTGFGYNSSGIRDVAISMDPGKGNFVRKAFNTSPILTNDSTNGVQYPENYFLGETFEDYILEKHNAAGTYTKTLAFLSPLKGGSDVEKANYRIPFQPAKTGYVFAQDLGASASFDPISTTPQKLFRIVGLTEGSWASKNIKISISNISYTAIDQDAGPYGTFNVEVRGVQDADDKPILLESFENVNLNPRSDRFIGRAIGDQYLKWNDENNKIEVYGEYPNNSRYVRVELHPTVKVGGADAKLLPFGFLGPARRKKFQVISGSSDRSLIDTSYVALATSYTHDTVSFGVPGGNLGDAIFGKEIDSPAFTASLEWPDFQLRVTASNATRGVARNAYFGIRTSRNDSGKFYSNAYVDLVYPLEEGVDPWESSTDTAHAFAFSLDDVRQLSSSDKGFLDNAAYESGTRQLDYVDKANKASISARGEYYKAEGALTTANARYSGEGWKVVLDAGYNAFTMPMHGGFDGIDIKQKNPFSISNVDGGATTDGRGNYAWFSVLTAIKQLRDPEYLEFNLAAVPGVVDATLNSKLADHCLERGDALAILDLDSGYRPLEDITANNISATTNRGTVSGAVDYRRNSISDVIHSYAATFYPWVEVADGRTNSVVSVPPTVAMMGVFGRVKQTSDVWFAPAGFQRGGLSDGSTGLRVLNVKDRLTSSERDELYDAGINPIANFPAEGIVVFGQKTLQLERSALDRINVRRLMIYLKQQIGGVASRTLFEQNVKATWDNFTRQAVGILEEVKDGLGLIDYKFVLDESTTTPDLIDQNILYAKLIHQASESD
jgi:hypothetical protein